MRSGLERAIRRLGLRGLLVVVVIGALLVIVRLVMLIARYVLFKKMVNAVRRRGDQKERKEPDRDRGNMRDDSVHDFLTERR